MIFLKGEKIYFLPSSIFQSMDRDPFISNYEVGISESMILLVKDIFILVKKNNDKKEGGTLQRVKRKYFDSIKKFSSTSSSLKKRFLGFFILTEVPLNDFKLVISFSKRNSM